MEADWASLPYLVVNTILRLLDVSSVGAVARTCGAWCDVAVHDDVGLWKYLCDRDWMLSEVATAGTPHAWRTAYASHVDRLGLACVRDAVYVRMARAMQRLEHVCRTQATSVSPLQRNAVQPDFVGSEAFAAVAPAVRALYHRYNGQDTSGGGGGVWGSYAFYDMHQQVFFLPWDMAHSLLRQVVDHNVMDVPPGSHMVGCGTVRKCVVVTPDGRVLEATRRVMPMEHVTYPVTPMVEVAPCFVAYVEAYVDAVLRGKYAVVNGCISLFPRLDVPTACTHGITVTAAPLFVPEMSTLPYLEQDRRYFWAYQIGMRVEEGQDVAEAQLRTRHWYIRNDANGQVEEVSGPGVIGLFPVMRSGCEDFFYASCSPQEQQMGTMWGFFTMQRASDGTTFDVQVPEFRFDATRFPILD